MWARQAIEATPSSAYSMAKAGLHALTQHLALELAHANIRVNPVSAAVVETPIFEAFIPKIRVTQPYRASMDFTRLDGSEGLRRWPRWPVFYCPTGRLG
jgi:NAD(P)-dependent dehydrogenase (short-subunit alcohol dehydrogenase family)